MSTPFDCRARRRGSKAWALAVVATALVLTRSAAADSPGATQRTASLAWIRSEGAESCVGPRALTAAIEQKLGRQAIVAPTRADMIIEGHIERLSAGGPWRVSIELVGESGKVLGRRELGTETPDCRALDDEIALVIAVLIDPGAALASAPPATAMQVLLPPPLFTPRAASPPAACPPPAPPPAPWRAGALVGAVGGLGLLPGPVPGFAVRGRLTPPRWPSFELTGAYWLHRQAGPGSVGADFSLMWGALTICPMTPEWGLNSLHFCTGIVLGALRAETIGFEPARRLEQVVFDVSAEVRYERRIIGPLLAGVGFGLLVPTVRVRFFYLNTQTQRRDVFEQAPLAGTGEVTVGVEFR